MQDTDSRTKAKGQTWEQPSARSILLSGMAIGTMDKRSIKPFHNPFRNASHNTVRNAIPNATTPVAAPVAAPFPAVATVATPVAPVAPVAVSATPIPVSILAAPGPFNSTPPAGMRRPGPASSFASSLVAEGEEILPTFSLETMYGEDPAEWDWGPPPESMPQALEEPRRDQYRAPRPVGTPPPFKLFVPPADENGDRLLGSRAYGNTDMKQFLFLYAVPDTLADRVDPDTGEEGPENAALMNLQVISATNYADAWRAFTENRRYLPAASSFGCIEFAQEALGQTNQELRVVLDFIKDLNQQVGIMNRLGADLLHPKGAPLEKVFRQTFQQIESVNGEEDPILLGLGEYVANHLLQSLDKDHLSQDKQERLSSIVGMYISTEPLYQTPMALALWAHAGDPDRTLQQLQEAISRFEPREASAEIPVRETV